MSTRLFLIAHAPLAQALHACAEHVFPDCAQDLIWLDVPPHEAPAHTLARAQALLSVPALPDQPDQPDQGAQPPTLVLSDVLGATPCNVAQQLLESHAERRLVTGVNLPMLLRTICYRHEGLDALALRAIDGAKAGVMTVAGSVPPPCPECTTCPHAPHTLPASTLSPVAVPAMPPVAPVASALDS